MSITKKTLSKTKCCADSSCVVCYWCEHGAIDDDDGDDDDANDEDDAR